MTSAKRPLPNDQELMLYVDDELDDARRRAVEDYLERHPQARNKIAALRLAGELVRDEAMGAGSAADGIADAVMAKLALEPPGLDQPRDQEMVNGTPSRPREVVPMDRSVAKEAPRSASRRPANDNARRIYLLTAAAVAAAAAMMVWGRSDPTPRITDGAGQRVAETAPIAPIAPAETERRVDLDGERPAAGEPTPEGDLEMGVEVAAVDFGTRQGSVFYVPSGSAQSAHTTTVVWLADDGGGGQ